LDLTTEKPLAPIPADTKPIPMLDLSAEVSAIRGELMDAFSQVLDSTEFILGGPVKAFEKEVGAYLGVKHAIALNSGTDALILALRAAGVGPGHEVITTSFSFFATAEAIHLVGATPVFVDIRPDTMNLDEAAVESRINWRTKALLPVHLFGCPAPLDVLTALAERHGLVVIEDVAQGFGSDWRGKKAGAWGSLGAFSFYPTKNLGAYGDGGLVTTNDDAFAETILMLRNHGSRKRYFHEAIGYNSRLDSLQAAVLRLKLPRVDGANEKRRELARRYTRSLSKIQGVRCPIEPEGGSHVFHQYTIRVLGGRRDQVQQALKARQIASTVYYPHTLPSLPFYSFEPGSFPEATRAAAEVLSLPLWPEMTESAQDRVVDAIRGALASFPTSH
jgi:dTDP-4-amino-4,6-dideoxygalactose transaminase